MSISEEKSSYLPITDNTYSLHIRDDLIKPSIQNQISSQLAWRRYWHKIGNWLECLSICLTGAAALLSIADNVFDVIIFTYLTSCACVGAVILQQFAKYAQNESSENTKLLNLTLKLLKIESVPDIGTETSSVKI